jgi:hypothetical protein
MCGNVSNDTSLHNVIRIQQKLLFTKESYQGMKLKTQSFIVAARRRGSSFVERRLGNRGQRRET